jgi:hypothetical protein
MGAGTFTGGGSNRVVSMNALHFRTFASPLPTLRDLTGCFLPIWPAPFEVERRGIARKGSVRFPPLWRVLFPDHFSYSARYHFFFLIAVTSGGLRYLRQYLVTSFNTGCFCHVPSFAAVLYSSKTARTWHGGNCSFDPLPPFCKRKYPL